MKIPEVLNNPEFLDAPLRYKWGKDIVDFYRIDAKNDKIDLAFEKLNHKATYGVITAFCEWIYWRVFKHDINFPLVEMSIKSQWASLIDKRYSFAWNYSGDYVSDVANSTLWTMLKIIITLRDNYYNGHYFFTGVDKLGLLARYVSPNKDVFDEWLEITIKKAAKLFPAQYDHREIVRNPRDYDWTEYDSSGESPIPREFFFDPCYDYETGNDIQLLNRFLSSLDYKNNKLLNSPEKMFELGFTGTPYQYKG